MRRSHYGAVSRINPEAAGVCDRGGEVCKHRDLMKEMVWKGRSLVWNGFLCCRRHIDPPHPQDQLLVLPPDPVPVKNARPMKRMVPIDGVLEDGVPTATETTGIVLAENNAPIRINKFEE